MASEKVQYPWRCCGRVRIFDFCPKCGKKGPPRIRSTKARQDWTKAILLATDYERRARTAITSFKTETSQARNRAKSHAYIAYRQHEELESLIQSLRECGIQWQDDLTPPADLLPIMEAPRL